MKDVNVAVIDKTAQPQKKKESNAVKIVSKSWADICEEVEEEELKEEERQIKKKRKEIEEKRKQREVKKREKKEVKKEEKKEEKREKKKKLCK